MDIHTGVGMDTGKIVSIRHRTCGPNFNCKYPILQITNPGVLELHNNSYLNVAQDEGQILYIILK